MSSRAEVLQSSNGTGRNMHQCMGVIEKMLPVQYPVPPNHITNLKRKSFSDLTEQPLKRQAVAIPSELPMAQRIIQPRPPLNGYPPVMAANTTTPSLTSTGKKRGRPSKADKEAQARATYPRSTEYAPITPAPLAPINIAPQQREYASSPGYEVSGSPADPRSRIRVGRPGASESSPTGLAYPLKSPASITDVPRALPEPIEHVERTTLSPQERGALTADVSKSAGFQPQQTVRQTPNPPQPQPHLPQPTASNTTQYTAAAPRHSPYDLPRGGGHDSARPLDPIFPDRDRSRSVSERIPRDMSPPQPPQLPQPSSSVTNRT